MVNAPPVADAAGRLRPMMAIMSVLVHFSTRLFLKEPPGRAPSEVLTVVHDSQLLRQRPSPSRSPPLFEFFAPLALRASQGEAVAFASNENSVNAMACDKIMLIRHAERPDPERKIRGVALDGRKEKESLAVRGCSALGPSCGSSPPMTPGSPIPLWRRPQILFACKAAATDPSLRPQRTRYCRSRTSFRSNSTAIFSKARSAPWCERCWRPPDRR